MGSQGISEKALYWKGAKLKLFNYLSHMLCN